MTLTAAKLQRPKFLIKYKAFCQKLQLNSNLPRQDQVPKVWSNPFRCSVISTLIRNRRQTLNEKSRAGKRRLVNLWWLCASGKCFSRKVTAPLISAFRKMRRTVLIAIWSRLKNTMSMLSSTSSWAMGAEAVAFRQARPPQCGWSLAVYILPRSKPGTTLLTAWPDSSSPLRIRLLWRSKRLRREWQAFSVVLSLPRPRLNWRRTKE